MLTLNEVSKVYKVGTFGGQALRAVSDVSFDVKDGEMISLIGESGSGKSTIGKMILRLISTTSGAIVFDETDVSTLEGGALKEYYRKVQGVSGATIMGDGRVAMIMDVGALVKMA